MGTWYAMQHLRPFYDPEEERLALTELFSEYIPKDIAWKLDAEPYRDSSLNWFGFSSIHDYLFLDPDYIQEVFGFRKFYDKTLNLKFYSLEFFDMNHLAACSICRKTERVQNPSDGLFWYALTDRRQCPRLNTYMEVRRGDVFRSTGLFFCGSCIEIIQTETRKHGERLIHLMLDKAESANLSLVQRKAEAELPWSYQKSKISAANERALQRNRAELAVNRDIIGTKKLPRVVFEDGEMKIIE